MANKTKEELTEEVEKKQQDRFIEELRELESKHGYKLEPIMHYSHRGIIPQITVVKNKVEVEVPTKV